MSEIIQLSDDIDRLYELSELYIKICERNFDTVVVSAIAGSLAPPIGFLTARRDMLLNLEMKE